MSILINVSIKLQQLTLVEVKKSELSESLLEVCMDYGPKRHTWHTKVIKSYTVSTALKGIGQTKNSFQTPIGLHYIRAKIGEGLPALSIFEGRRPTGEIWSKDNAVLAPKDDWILSRIMWLSGKEFGINRLSNSDTMQRYIYIHGTHDESNLGKPLSHGCIRMSNDDVIELFDLVSAGTIVHINEE